MALRKTIEPDQIEPVPDLDDTDPFERRRAIRLAAATPRGAATLVARLHIEPVASVRELILTVLAEQSTPETVRALLPFLGSDDASLRNAVADALTLMPEHMAGEVPALLTSADHDVRIMTIMVVGKLHHPRVPEWLVSVAEHDPHPNVVGCALNELLRLPDHQGRQCFALAADRFPQDPFIGFLTSLAEADG